MHKNMKGLAAAMLLMILMAVACGGGGADGVTTDGGNSLGAGFVPVQPAPGSNTASMNPGNANGAAVGIQVTVTDTDTVYGAAFRVDYDATRVQFVSWTPGTILERGGHHPTYQVDGASTPGSIFVGASRNGNVPAVHVTSTEALVVLNFRVLQAGDSPLQFSDEQLYNGQVPPQPLNGIHWFAGAFHAN